MTSPVLDFTRFEIRHGSRRIVCTVADEALDAVSSLPAPSTLAMRRRSFDRFRTLINAAAKLKVAGLPVDWVSPIVLQTRDLRQVAPEVGTPLFGSAARPSTRPPVG